MYAIIVIIRLLQIFLDKLPRSLASPNHAVTGVAVRTSAVQSLPVVGT